MVVLTNINRIAACFDVIMSMAWAAPISAKFYYKCSYVVTMPLGACFKR